MPEPRMAFMRLKMDRKKLTCIEQFIKKCTFYVKPANYH